MKLCLAMKIYSTHGCRKGHPVSSSQAPQEDEYHCEHSTITFCCLPWKFAAPRTPWGRLPLNAQGFQSSCHPLHSSPGPFAHPDVWSDTKSTPFPSKPSMRPMYQPSPEKQKQRSARSTTYSRFLKITAFIFQPSSSVCSAAIQSLMN